MHIFKCCSMIGLVFLLNTNIALTQEDIGFRSAEEYDTSGQPFSTEIIHELIDTLDRLLDQPDVKSDFTQQSRIHFWRFMNRLAKGILTPEQDAIITSFLNKLKTLNPDHSELIDRQQWQIEHLMLGKEAPDIVGTDMDGIDFRLSEYRDKIVVLVFTGHWCGPCRGEYPYQRLLLEVMAEEPVVLLGVNSDEDLQMAKQAKEEEQLEYRTWWDGHGEVAQKGPIATSWNIVGWPTIYIIDAKGRIRFKDTRHEEMITAVKKLLDEMRGFDG